MRHLRYVHLLGAGVLLSLLAWPLADVGAVVGGGADADYDGVPDVADAFSCDWRRAAVTFVPSESDYATLMFEDNWPAHGDLDFNDAVVLYNFAVFQDGSGRATGLRAVLVPRAVGASIVSGVGLRLPVPAQSVRSIVRTIGANAPTNLAAASSDGTLVVPVISSLPELFGNATDHVNTRYDLPPLGDGPQVVVEIEFRAPLSLPVADDAFDLYFFRTQDPSHEVHRPQFAGTDAMNVALFGTFDDGSDGLRNFVDGSGLPFVLAIPAQSRWAREFERVDLMWPDIVDFAQSGGLRSTDFYASHIDQAHAYPAAPAITPPAVAYAICVAPSCTDGARNGLETDTDCGGPGCGPCASGAACTGHDDCASGICETNLCVDGSQRGCTLAHGTGIETRSGASWSACSATACDAGYRASGGACVLLTYAWSAGAWGTCAGGTGSPSYGTWSACGGGGGSWSYGTWGACSASAVCSGSGSQSRSASCTFTAGSGAQSRSASCTWDASSGTAARSVGCVNNFGEAVASGQCAGAPPATTQSCTPGGTPSSCGTLVTSQSCTPSDSAVCGASTTSQSCASPSGSQSCAVSNGTGTQSCAAGATSWSACAPVSCSAGFHLQSGACTSDVQSCTIANGTGTQTWNGSAYGACTVASCSSGYRASGNTCVLVTYAWSIGGWGTCGGGSASPSYGAWGSCSGGSGAWGYGAWGTCGGGSGSPSYGAWGSCGGGSGAWGYGAWGACSASSVCSGAGSQSRSATCNVNANSGSQSRSGSCVYNANSGSQSRSATCNFTTNSGSQSRSAACQWDASSGAQTRSVSCGNNFGETVANASCGSAPASTQACTPASTPASCGAVVTAQSCTPTNSAVCGASTTNQSCTPSGTPASCGALVTSQSCTPSGSGVCGASTTSQSCASPSGSQACAISNGSGSQACAAGSTSWGACTVTGCNAGYTQSGNACVAANPCVSGPFQTVAGCSCGSRRDCEGYDQHTNMGSYCEVRRVNCLCVNSNQQCP